MEPLPPHLITCAAAQSGNSDALPADPGYVSRDEVRSTEQAQRQRRCVCRRLTPKRPSPGEIHERGRERGPGNSAGLGEQRLARATPTTA